MRKARAVIRVRRNGRKHYNPAEPMLSAMPPITLALILLNVLVHALGLATSPEIVRVFGQWPGFGRELFGKR